MLQSLKGVNLSELPLESLEGIADAVEAFTFKQKQTGEPFHPSYRRNRKMFKKLINQTVRFKRDIQHYFVDQYARIIGSVPLYLIKADDSPDTDPLAATFDTYIKQMDWNEENRKLSVTLEFNLSGLFSLGVAATNLELATDIDVGPHTTAEAKFLREYSLKLAGEISATTKKRIKQQIQTSIELGETRGQLTARIDNILNSPARARAIAQTESIRAFAEGRIAVGRQLKVPYKQWQSFQVDAGEICGMANGEVVPLEENFKNGRFGPPAHVNCRCSLKLLYTNPNDKQDQSDIPDLSDDESIFETAR